MPKEEGLTDACNSMPRNLDAWEEESTFAAQFWGGSVVVKGIGAWQHSGEPVVQPYLHHPRLLVPTMKHGDLTQGLAFFYLVSDSCKLKTMGPGKRCLSPPRMHAEAGGPRPIVLVYIKSDVNCIFVSVEDCFVTIWIHVLTVLHDWNDSSPSLLRASSYSYAQHLNPSQRLQSRRF